MLLATLAIGLAGYAFPSTRALLGALLLNPVLPLHQGIIGNVTMDFWGTICTTLQSVPTTGRDLTITSNNGRTLGVALSWALHYQCVRTASFLVDLTAGTYSVTLSPTVQCSKPQPGEFGGIMCNFPYMVEVEPGIYSHVVLGVSGGM